MSSPPPNPSHSKTPHRASKAVKSVRRFSKHLIGSFQGRKRPDDQLGQQFQPKHPEQSEQQVQPEHSEQPGQLEQPEHSEQSGQLEQPAQSKQLSEEEKFKMRKTLYYLFCDIEDLSFSALDDESLARLHIRVEAFPTTETAAVGQNSNTTPGPAVFFEPISKEEIHRYPFGPEDEDAQMNISSLPKILENIGEDSADFLCCEIAQLFGACRSSLPRTELGTQSLKRVRGWRYSGGFTKSIFRELYAETLFFEEIPAFAPVASWVTNNQQERPHIMLTLRHEATVDERLLRGELLTIVAAMNSRLSFRYFRRHAVAPIMIFSFMNHCRGRIIQGYYDGHEVVLRKSKLFDFSNPKTAPFELFVRHLASAPAGDTETLPERLPTPTEDVADGDITTMDSPKHRAQRPGIPSFEPPSPQEPLPGQHSSLPISLKGKEPELRLSPEDAPGDGDQTSAAG